METWNLIPENIKSISLIPVANPIQELTALGVRVGGYTYNRLVLGREATTSINGTGSGSRK